MKNRKIDLIRDIIPAKENLHFPQNDQWEKIQNSSFVTLTANETVHDEKMENIQNEK